EARMVPLRLKVHSLPESGQRLVRTVAQWRLPRPLAAAKEHLRVGGGMVWEGRELAALMGTVAKRLGGRAAAGTPVVGLAGLDVHRDGTASRNRWLRHMETVPVALQRRCLGGSMLPAGGRREAAGHGARRSSSLRIRGNR